MFFGDQAGVVYSLNAATGALLWKTRLDAHADARVTGAPSLYENRLYVPVTWSEPMVAANSGKGCCTLQGAVEALDSATGAVVWKTDLRQVQAGAAPLTAAGTPIWSAPTVDPKRGLLYVAAGNCEAIVALDLTDGKPRWFTRLAAGDARKTDEDRIFGNSPILRQMTSGRQVILAGQQAGLVYGLDPDHAGAVLWRTRVATGGEADGVEWSPAADHRSLYVAIADVHPEQRRDRGGIAALDIATGELRWSAPSPQPSCGSSDINCSFGQAQAVTVIPGILFAGSIDGHLRAYSTIDGKLVWDFDTAKTYRTVNGSTAAGGPLGHGGPTIVSGMVYVNSGYGGRPGSPGHVLLAFSVGGK